MYILRYWWIFRISRIWGKSRIQQNIFYSLMSQFSGSGTVFHASINIIIRFLIPSDPNKFLLGIPSSRQLWKIITSVKIKHFLVREVGMKFFMSIVYYVCTIKWSTQYITLRLKRLAGESKTNKKTIPSVGVHISIVPPCGDLNHGHFMRSSGPRPMEMDILLTL